MAGETGICELLFDSHTARATNNSLFWNYCTLPDCCLKKNDLHLIEDGLELTIKTFLPDDLCLWQLVLKEKITNKSIAHMVTLEVAVNIVEICSIKHKMF